MRQTEPAHPSKIDAPIRSGILQRKCACGQHAGGSECEECKKKQKMQRRRSQGTEPSEVPPIVHEAVRDQKVVGVRDAAKTEK
ncbi:MAG TPA: hypothetical protein VLB76_11555 [Thermoanaerobaculia bacterium]|jgi:hypothetical protein|nr:hypothetical protein [Thermoanaerobaculia bacterium]